MKQHSDCGIAIARRSYSSTASAAFETLAVYTRIRGNRDALSEVIKNTIFGESGPKSLVRELTRKDRYFSVVSQGFTEMAKSLETLEDIALYMRRFPFQGTR